MKKANTEEEKKGDHFIEEESKEPLKKKVSDKEESKERKIRGIKPEPGGQVLIQRQNSDRRESGIRFTSEHGSSASLLKGHRWNFSGSYTDNNKDQKFIFMPLTSIDMRFRVIEMLYADAYGETYRILLAKRRSNNNLPLISQDVKLGKGAAQRQGSDH